MKTTFTTPFVKLTATLGVLVALLLPSALFAGGTIQLVDQNAGTTSNWLSGGYVFNSLTIANQNATNTTVGFFDSPTGTLTWTNAAYTTTSYASGSVEQIYTNYFGVLTTNTYTALLATSVTNAAATNNWPKLLTVSVPTNGTVTLTGTFRFIGGVVTTNGGAKVSITGTYQ